MAPKNSITVTFFNTPFPENDCTEWCPDVYFNHAENAYDHFNLDIGWCLRGGNSNCVGDDPSIRIYYRVCCGYNVCEDIKDEKCILKDIQLRPAVKPSVNKKRLKQGCKGCNGDLVHYSCPVRVYYKFIPEGCEMRHQGTHSHKVCSRKHLSATQNRQMDELVTQHPAIQPKAASIGIDQQNRRVIEPAYNIDPILINRERVGYEMRKAKERKGQPISAKDPIEAFSKIQYEYPYFLMFANLIEQHFFISFKSPTIGPFVNFSQYPIVTDITYKAVRDCYLCSSVIYSPEIAKHVVIFQAIMKSTTTWQLQQYFLFLFTACKLNFIDKDKVFGFIMDFSQAEINGFLAAYSTYTSKDDGLMYLKGCYMHWMQSVQRVSSNHNAIPPPQRQFFLRWVYKIRTTTSEQVFNNQLFVMTTQFPATRSWIKWWLQPTIRSMNFNTCSVMKPSLRESGVRTGSVVRYVLTEICSNTFWCV
ncbi:hypothetical protein O0I10_012389 [Lichtheimia ornata]|uniref:GCM domain-containing protein n=1 Tax=Lichtheimia ornata TaxID=688661 RepID=A0AAD7XPL9_9FUNG|nr:uncharacterized protein O0I10_012389 [Lichtheimia ornata]KAJ8651994.1 hypothetical protein O0I10_012389 [Lichtheimia ornata]